MAPPPHRFGAHDGAGVRPAELTGAAVKHDDIIVVEVMAETLDRSWWSEYRIELEQMFEQDEMIIRAQTYETV